MGVDRIASTRPLVSVLVPAYNHDRYVDQCLNSIVADGYRPLEIVVIDDGSSDDTWHRIETWSRSAPEDVSVIALRQENAGVSATLGRALELCSGDFVAPVASDDLLIPGGIHARLREMGDGVDAVFGDAEIVDSGGHLLHPSVIRHLGGVPERLREPRRIPIEFALRWATAGPLLLIRRSALIEAGGFAAHLQVEDLDLYLRLAAAHSLRFIPRTVAAYRLHSSNANRDPVTQRARDAEERRVLLERAPEFGLAPRMLLTLRAAYLSALGARTRTVARPVVRALRRILS